MIIDSISNIRVYRDIHPLFEKAVSFVLENVNNPEGKYEIDGDRVFVTFTEADLRSAENAPLESHRKYIDIQIVLRGMESFGWRAVSDCTTPKEEFDTEKDIVFYADAHDINVTAQSGQFVVFLPTDAHAPLIGNGTVRKAIVKIAVI